ncbi:MAG: amino acid adenylation domain-containing protein [Cytophagales bacterium]|nr:amino acid adenylation domain-containing protein [Cytophagales bacterium]
MSNLSTIKKSEKKEYYRLSPAQKRLYVIQQLNPDSVAYNLTKIIPDYSGDLTKVEDTLNEFVQQHEIFRTAFKNINGNPVQVVQDKGEIRVGHLQAEDLTLEEAPSVLMKPFRLDEFPLIRLTHVTRGKQQSPFLFIEFHHIIFDAVSTSLFNKAFSTVSAGGKWPLPTLQYRDYSEWYFQSRKIEKIKKQENFWQNKFLTPAEPLALPISFPRPQIKSDKGKACRFKIDENTTLAIRSLAQAYETTMSTVLLCVFKTFLKTISGQSDIVVGVPVTGRNRKELTTMFGTFINAIPIRSYPADHLTFVDYLNDLKENVKECFNNQDFQFDELVESLNLQRDNSRSPLFDVTFDVLNHKKYKHVSSEVLSIDEIDEATLESCKSIPSNYDVVFKVLEYDTKIDFIFEYCTELFSSTQAVRFIRYFNRILISILKNPVLKISEIELLDKVEKQKLLYQFNDSAVEIPQEKTVLSLFKEQVIQHPDRSALVFEGTTLTYQELDQKSNGLASYLIDRGIGPGSIVGLMTQKSPKLVIGILGILKAGGAYLPIDTDLPDGRKEYLLKDSGANALLVTKELEGKVEYTIPTFFVEDAENLTEVKEVENRSKASDLCYVIYTSGSTGKPKGVMIEHGALINYIGWASEYYLDGEDATFGLYTSISFDLTVTSIFTPLISGNKIIISQEQQGGLVVEKMLREGEVNVLKLTPSHLKILNDSDLVPASNKTIKLIVGGEELETSLAQAIHSKFEGQVEIYNEYGPTEATVGCMIYRFVPDEQLQSVPIGHPINNTQIYILDSYLKPIPVGIQGELYVSGLGVARGYINNEALTDQRFLANPFVEGTKMYRTGDLVQMLDDGTVLYKGRIDDQVKIRGYRIELGEIEHQLSTYDLVKEAVAVVRDVDDEEEKYLVGYYLSDEKLDESVLKEYLSERLPEYMLPSFYVHMEEWPLTSNGKLDKKALPDPEIVAGDDYEAPSNETEEKLVEIWSEILKVSHEKISVSSNFFTIGGDSIKAIRLVVAINKGLSVKISLKNLFDHSSIAALSDYISESGVDNGKAKPTALASYSEIEQLKERVLAQMQDTAHVSDIFPMSDIEKGMVYHSLSNIEEAVYHDQNVYNVKYKQFDIAIFEKALTLMVAKHTNLRKSFNLDDYETQVSIVHKEVPVIVSFADISSKEKEEQENIVGAFMKSDRENPFKFDRAPLWRAKVFQTTPGDVLFLWTFHHSILDGWSSASLMTELNNTYLALLSDKSFQPKPLKADYKDFVAEQMTIKNNDETNNYWKAELDDVSGMEFKDLDATDKESRELGRVQKRFPKEIYKLLEERSKKYNTGIKEICFAAYLYASKMMTYHNEVMVGLVTNNRPVKEGGDQILGCFLNTIPFKISISEPMVFGDLVRHVDRKMSDIRAHQQLSLFEILNQKSDSGPTSKPLFNSIFNHNDFHIYKELKSEDVSDGQEKTSHKLDIALYEKTNYDLDFMMSTMNDSLYVEISYAKSEFREEYVQKFLYHFEQVLELEFRTPDKVLNTGDLLNGEEKHQLLSELNTQTTDYSKDDTIVKWFEDQVDQTPEDTAIMLDERAITYRELNLKANQLANNLRNEGVEKSSVIGLMVDRSMEMFIGILGILKAGCTYLPLSKSQPLPRTKYMLEKSDAELLLTTEDKRKEWDPFIKTINVDDPGLYAPNGDGNPDIPVSSEDVAYIIFTSGSTGMPKGVMTRHYSVINLIRSQQQLFQINKDEKILQFSSFTFDASVEQMWLSLLQGATLVLITEDIIIDTAKFNQYLSRHAITHLHATPSFLENISLDHHPSLKRVVAGGEECSVSLANKFSEKYQFFNEYGPTETTVTSIIREVSKSGVKGHRVPVGKPIDNTGIYVLDEQRQLLPKGITGELYISGHGLGKGYVNDDALTRQKFIENPYGPGERMYATGDLARWLPNGELEFLGRIDDQVKIRGFRIELGEIEHHLTKHEQIKESVVLAKGKDSEKYLVAYYTSEGIQESATLIKYLSEKLPDYMVPDNYIHLDKLPLNANGKLDKKALPDPDIEIDDNYVAPSSEVEELLVKIWSEVLKLDKEAISVTRSFFELGGHSLRATVLINKILKVLAVEVPLKAVFQYRDIQSLGQFISGLEKTAYQVIEPADKKAYYTLSSAQRRLYFLYQFDKTSLAYNMPQVVRLQGNLDRKQLEKALQQLVAHHESLRTYFEVVDEEPVQKILEQVAFQLEYFESTDEQVPAVIKSFIRPFDLSHGPLIRAGLITTHATEESAASPEHILMVDIHHIVADGVSQGILVKDFMNLYHDESLPDASLHYKDYAEWQRGESQQTTLAKQKAFWLNEFAEEAPLLELPVDFTRPSVKSYEGDSLSFELTVEETARLKTVADREGATLFMVILSVYNVLLGKLSNQEDIVIGTPLAGRQHEDLKSMIGMFVNTLPLRNYPKGELTFREFLAEVKSRTLACFDNQNYQYDELIDELQMDRNISRNPLFDVMFSYQNLEDSELKMRGLTLKPYSDKKTTSKFDLLLSSTEHNDRLYFGIEYYSAIFSLESIQKIIYYFKYLTSQITSDPDQKISALSLLDEPERNKILYGFNDTSKYYEEEPKTLHEIFEEQVNKAPDAVALTFKGKSLTYRELNNRSNQLATTLRAKGITRNKVVGVMQERSFEMIISVLAILKAGGAYLPIDPEFPAERIKYIFFNSQLTVLLTDNVSMPAEETTEGLARINVQEINFESSETKNIKNVNVSTDLSYVIYTSGSTGKPKGAMLNHINMTNLLDHQYSEEKVDYGSVLQFTTLSFDASAMEIFSALLKGGKLHLIGKETVQDFSKLLHHVRENEVEAIYMPSSVLNQIFNTKEYMHLVPSTIKHIVTTGEQLIIGDLFKQYLQKNQTYIHNHYGPAETQVVTAYTVSPTEVIPTMPPIGRPIQNTFIYILDKYMQPQPVHVTGELYIGGKQVGEGYIHNETLTAKKFIDNPFVPGDRLYKTGDLARWLPDGNIEFLGRVDQQVKIRGIRIEPGEIESQLNAHDQITESAVITKGKGGDKYLVAYYVSKEEISPSELRSYLSKKLPAYMMPGHFVHMAEMPFTPSGKLYRKALPDPEFQIGDDYDAPSNEVEEHLVEIWSEVLKLDKEVISVTRSFFELGGHSLRATVLVNKIFRVLSIEVPLKTIFQHQDIRSLSQYIREADKTSYQSIEPAAKQEYYPLSSAQRRMYFLYQFEPNALTYNMPQIVRLEGVLAKNSLELAFNELVARHESLRTSFALQGDEPVQCITDWVDLHLEHYRSDEAGVQEVITSFIRPFDLSEAPLIRVGLISVAEDSTREAEEHILMVDLHHIITDGVSQGLLIRDFMSLYEGEDLSPVHLHYKDYAVWQQAEAQQSALSQQKAFWLQEYSDLPPVLELPYDHKRPLVKKYQGGNLGFALAAEQTAQLKSIAESEGATLFMLMLSMYNILLSKLSNQEDIVIGTPTAGRQHADVDDMIGMFVNTMALRNYPKGKMSFREFLSAVQSGTLTFFDHQGYQYEELVDELKIERDTSRNPLFDVMFAYQNFEESTLQMPGLKLAAQNSGHTVSKFDLTLTVSENIEQLHLNFEYSTELFEKHTIERFNTYFVKIVEQVISNPEITLSDIVIISEEERLQILETFNDTKADFPTDKTVIDLFESQAARTPDKTALIFKNEELSYKSFHGKVDQVTDVLLNRGVKQGDIVGLMSDRSFDLMAGIFGIMKAGATYLPISPDYPTERINFLIEDSGMQLMLTGSSVSKKDLSPIALISLDSLEDKPFGAVLESRAQPEDLAYIIYTSGSTGNPKGVEITHRSLHNLINWMDNQYPLAEDDRYLFKTSHMFDVSMTEIFGWLLSGGSMVILPQGDEANVDNLLHVIDDKHVTHINFVPSMFAVFVGELTSKSYDRISGLKHIFLAGEALTISLVNAFNALGAGITLDNIYGPTEGTVYCCSYSTTSLGDQKSVPIGKPLINTNLLVLDQYMGLQPVGVPGELCISGEGVARGYANNEKLTKAKFIENPFSPGDRMYRTGDLARWLPDGNIEYIGRIDDQVKIRGFRIEPGEIAYHLVSHNEIKETVVVVKKKEGENYLVAYYVSEEAQEPSALRNYLSERLPEYMVPGYYVHLYELPLNANGKTDKKALPDPEVEVGEDFIAPSNATEEQLVELWSQVLKIDKEVISVTRSFFELGGHSLRATILMNKIFKMMEVEVPLREIFRKQTIRDLSGYIITIKQLRKVEVSKGEKSTILI